MLITLWGPAELRGEPLVADGQVAGFLHADLRHHELAVDDADRAVLAIFAEGVSHVLTRTLVVERLYEIRNGVQYLASSLRAGPHVSPRAPALPSMQDIPTEKPQASGV